MTSDSTPTRDDFKSHLWLGVAELIVLMVAMSFPAMVPVMVIGAAVFLLLAPFVWLAWYWWPPVKSPRLRRLGRMLVSGFLSTWAILFGLAAVLFFAALVMLTFSAEPRYAGIAFVGALCVACAWLAWQIQSAVGRAPRDVPVHREVRAERRPRSLGRSLVSAFLVAWAAVFGALALLFFAILAAAAFGPEPRYGMVALTGVLCIVCAWLTWQIGTAVREPAPVRSNS